MTRPRNWRPSFWILAAIVLAGAVLRFRALDFGLPYTQARPDETFIIDSARTLLSGRAPQFFDYPWLYIGLVALGDCLYYLWGALTGRFDAFADMLASWPGQFIPFFVIPRALSALAGTLTLLVVYRLGRQVRDEVTGLTAALFMAFAFLHVRDSHFGTTDITMTLFIMTTVSLLLDADRTQQPRHYALAGLCAGLASATKYNAAILLVPMVLVYGRRVFEQRNAWRKALLDRRLGALLLPFAGGFALGVPFVFFDWPGFVAAMQLLVDSMKTGDTRLALDNGWLHHLRLSLRYGLGLPLLATSLVGMALMIRLKTREALVALAFPIAYFLVAGSIRNLFFRYMIPAVPFLCLAAAFLVSWLASALANRLTRATDERQGAMAHVLATALAMLLVFPAVRQTVELDRVLNARDNRQVVSDFFHENVPAGATLLQSGSRFGHARFAMDRGYREYRWDGGRGAFTLNGKAVAERPDWILVQDSPLPSATQDVVREFLSEGYVRAAEFKATALDPDIVYDRQDAFFVPFNGLERIERPGPNFTLFLRAASGAIADADAAPPPPQP